MLTYQYVCSCCVVKSFDGFETVDSDVSKYESTLADHLINNEDIMNIGNYVKIDGIKIEAKTIAFDGDCFIIIFESNKVLTRENLEAIRREFDGQMSDGYGEGIEQRPFKKVKYVSEESRYSDGDYIEAELYLKLWWNESFMKEHLGIPKWFSSCSLDECMEPQDRGEMIKKFMNRPSDPGSLNIYVDWDKKTVYFTNEKDNSVLVFDRNLMSSFCYKSNRQLFNKFDMTTDSCKTYFTDPRLVMHGPLSSTFDLDEVEEVIDL